MAVGLPAVVADQKKMANLNPSLPLAVELAINPRTLVQSLETHTIPATPYKIVIAPPNGGAFMDDRGVQFTVGGTALTRLAPNPSTGIYPTPTTGQYIVDITSGTYTFAAADGIPATGGLGVQISYNYTDGSVDVSWCITGGTPGIAPIAIAGGATHMLSTDKIAKLLYTIRGAWLQALQNLTVAQIMPPAYLITPNAGTGLPAAGASFYAIFPVDMIAALPSNTASVGL
jgi:hypothetical protein